MLHEQGTPYGIIKTQAILVPDDHIANRKVCIIDSGYDINHPDLPSQATGAVITGTGYGGANGEWDIDTNGHGTHECCERRWKYGYGIVE